MQLLDTDLVPALGAWSIGERSSLAREAETYRDYISQEQQS